MEENYYITSDGILKRKQNTVYFVNKDMTKPLPVENIRAIFAYGRITFSSGVVAYLCKKQIPIHFFNKYNFYEGSLWPRQTQVSGDLLIKQVQHYLDKEKRLALAREFVRGCARNMIKNLQYYQRNGKEVGEELRNIETGIISLDSTGDIKQTLAAEGNIWNNYYSSFDKITPEDFRFEKRTKRPPENMMNCLISFGNSLLYGTTLTEIYNTQLNPTVSYLHEPSERRFSLCLDVSEVFKPIIADRVIFKLINKRIIQEDHFVKELGSCLLNDTGRRLFLQEYKDKLETTIKHKDLGRNVSYQTLIRLECYKLIKHLIGETEYNALIMDW